MAIPLGKTKHYQLAQQLCHDIRKMPPGTPLPTIEELKTRFGASQVTIDKAILRLKRDGLIHRPDGRKRLVVANVAEQALKRVALIRPDYPSIVFEEIARAVVTSGRKLDWAFDVVYYRDQKNLDLAQAIDEADAAVLLIDPRPLPARLLKELRHPRKPVVVASIMPDEPEISTVSTDDRRVIELLTQHLLDLGHRRIAIITSTLDDYSMSSAVQGWRDTMARAGIMDCEELLINAQVPRFEYALRWIYHYFSNWLDNSPPPFTAIVGTATDSMLAAMRALREHGRKIPAHVSVVGSTGFTNFAAYLDPPITSVTYDMNAYGEAVIGLLGGNSSQKSASGVIRQVQIQPNLLLGQSTASPVKNGEFLETALSK